MLFRLDFRSLSTLGRVKTVKFISPHSVNVMRFNCYHRFSNASLKDQHKKHSSLLFFLIAPQSCLTSSPYFKFSRKAAVSEFHMSTSAVSLLCFVWCDRLGPLSERFSSWQLINEINARKSGPCSPFNWIGISDFLWKQRKRERK